MTRCKKSSLWLSIFILFVSFSNSVALDCAPQQIHLTLGDLYSDSRIDNPFLPSGKSNDNLAYLTWITKTTELCDFTISITDVESKKVEVSKKSVTIHENYAYDFANDLEGENRGYYSSISYTALLVGLKLDHTYEYSIEEKKTNKTHGPFEFNLPAQTVTFLSKKILLLGGIDNLKNGDETIHKLKEISKTGQYAALIHLGNAAHSIQSQNGTGGDKFFQSIQDIASRLPYIISPGVNDNFDQGKLLNFRVKNPLFNLTQNQYFSFDLQGIHFVSINFDYYSKADANIKKSILSWAHKDLKTADEQKHRSLYPWVVVISNSPLYCTYNEKIGDKEKVCSDFYEQKKDWDALFHEHSVDLVVSGSMDYYQRLKPMYKNQPMPYAEIQTDSKTPAGSLNMTDPEGAIFIVEGAGRTFGEKDTPWFGSLDTTKTSSVFYDKRHGYGVMQTEKTTSGQLRLIYEHYSSETGHVIDKLNLIKTNIVGKNRTPYFVFVFIMAIGVVVITVGIVLARKWRRKELEEDNIPLTSGAAPMRSNRLRYARPGEKGIKMVDLVLC